MVKETVTKKAGWDDSDEYNHPSFGNISISKRTCGGDALFGSSVRHDTMIALRIKEGNLNRKYATDSYSGRGKSIVEVLLSPLQFSEMLTTMNTAEGIPCTISHRNDYGNGQLIEYPEEFAHKDKLQEFLDEAGDTVKELQKFIKPHLNKVLSNLDTSKPLGKAAQKELAQSLQTVYNQLGSNPKFHMEQFAQYMDRTVLEAKATIDSHVDTVIRQTGIEAINRNKLFIGDDK